MGGGFFGFLTPGPADYWERGVILRDAGEVAKHTAVAAATAAVVAASGGAALPVVAAAAAAAAKTGAIVGTVTETVKRS